MLKLWNSSDLALLGSEQSPTTELWKLAYSPSANAIATANDDGAIRIYLRAPPRPDAHGDHLNTVACLGFANSSILSFDSDGVVDIFDPSSRKEEKVQLPLDLQSNIRTVRFHPKIGAFVVGYNLAFRHQPVKGRIAVWYPQPPIRVERMDFAEAIASISCHPTEPIVAFVTPGGTLGLRTVPDLQPLPSQSDFALNLKSDALLVERLGWSNRGDVLLLALNRENKNTSEIVRFHFDGKSLSPVNPGNPVEVPALIGSFAWHPSDQLVAIGTKGDAAILHDFTAGQTKTVVGHDGPVNVVAWSADGLQLFTGGDDRIIKVWAYHAAAKDKLTSTTTLHHDKGGVQAIGVCPDGKGIYTAGTDPGVFYWPAASYSVDAIVARAHEMVNRNMTRAEWLRYAQNDERRQQKYEKTFEICRISLAPSLSERRRTADFAEQLMIYLNGINPRTGNYLVTPLQTEKLFELVTGGDESDQAGLRSYLHSKIAVAGVPAGVNENDPAEAGWGVVFHESESREVINACQLLIEHRKTQIPRNRVKTFTYRGGQTFNKWLAELGVGAGHIDPDKVPLYLLIVGDPEKVPFSFSQRLGLEYRVGRLAFDKPSDYESYFNSLIRLEHGHSVTRAGELVVFAPSDDVPTQLSCDQLAEPLAQKLGERLPVEPLLRRDATKIHLLERLRSGAPRFFFSASHGLGFALEDDDQGKYQGALVCQRKNETGPLTSEDFFLATDVPEDLDLTGMTAFFFACFSAATPASDRFFRQKGGARQLAKKTFFSALPRRLLSNPGGAALAVLGHIDRAWGFSILNEFSDALRIPFENALLRPLNGTPTGQALRDFYDRFASYSVELTDLIDTRELGGTVDQKDLILAWARRNDAAGYILLGDPAARIVS